MTDTDKEIVLRLAKLFRKLYVGTDCQTTYKIHDVNQMIRECFNFEGDNLETGQMILELTKEIKDNEKLE